MNGPAEGEEPVDVAVMGAGMIGRRHIEHIARSPAARLTALVDPAPDARALAESLRVPWFPALTPLLEQRRPEAIVIATPNQMHVANGVEAIAAGVAVLMEKPIADELEPARTLVDAAERAGVPLLVGHHRRHNPMMQAAKSVIDSGRLGRVVAAHGMCWFRKPDDYFEPSWRRQKGAGPVFLNLIHDVDNFRFLFGEVTSVQAIESNTERGHAVEDTSAMVLRFESGVLATITVSDAIVAPWSWELTTGENPAYPKIDESCYMIGGSHASMTLPALEIWQNQGVRSWFTPLTSERVWYAAEDPLAAQIRNLCAVVRGREPPRVSGRDGLRTLEVILAVKEAAASGRTVTLGA